MAHRTCTVSGCTKKHVAKGFCTAHYQRWKKTGDPGSAQIRKPSPRTGACSVAGCDRVDHAHGYCVSHYYRWRRTGDAGQPFPSRFTVDRIAERVAVDQTTGCWLWAGFLMPNGYGQMSVGNKKDYAHRVSYEAHVGPIPEGLELDHLCHTKDRSCAGGDDCPHRACVNPDHLEPVTRRVNTIRSMNFAGVAFRKTHCDRGHAYTPENTYIKPNGTRRCKTCHRMIKAKSYAKLRKAKSGQ